MSLFVPDAAQGSPRTKICGLRRLDDVVAATEAGADMLGFVFAPSRRRVDAALVRSLLAEVPAHPPAVGVFVDLPVAQINAIVAEAGLAFVQLSGGERGAAAAGLRVPYLKVIHVSPGDGIEPALRTMQEHAAAAAFLVDSSSPLGGGSGITADWGVAAALVRHAGRPVFLAGGLHPANVGAGLAATGAYGVDVSSGVERDGWKDRVLIEAFVAATRRQSACAQKPVDPLSAPQCVH